MKSFQQKKSIYFIKFTDHYDWLRSPDEYMAQHMSLRSLDPGTTYQVRVVAKNGDGYEAASVWQEFLTPGVGRLTITCEFSFLVTKLFLFPGNYY